MNVYDLVKALDGEIVSNKAKVRVDGLFVVVGRVIGDEMAMTEEGELLVAEMAKKPGKKQKKSPAEPDKTAGSDTEDKAADSDADEKAAE